MKKKKQTKQKETAVNEEKATTPKSLSEMKTKEGVICTNIIISAHPNSKTNSILGSLIIFNAF